MKRSAMPGGLLAAVLGLVVGGPGVRAQPAANAPSASPPAAATPVPGLTVTAPPIKDVPELVQKFAMPTGARRLARWEWAVCPSVRGMPEAYDRFVEARLKQIVTSVGGVAGGPRCRVDLAILVVPDAETIAKAIARHHRWALEGGDRWPVDRARLAAFVSDAQPVRVWRVTDAVQTDGGTAAESSAPAQSAALLALNSSLFAPPEYSESFASRLTPFTNEAFRRVLVIVDGRQAQGVSVGQLSAYLAMVSLAQVRPDADLNGVDTIVNLFADRRAGRPAPRDLTFWDRAYLQSLYKTDAQINPQMQLSFMSDHIKRDIAAHNVMPLSATQAAAPGQAPPGPQ